jgi:hypothetical protein
VADFFKKIPENLTMIASNNPAHAHLVDTLNTLGVATKPPTKQGVLKTMALTSGVLGFLFFNFAPPMMQYGIGVVVVLAWLNILWNTPGLAPTAWITDGLKVGYAYKDFTQVTTQLKILDPSLSEIFEQIAYKLDHNTERYTGEWLTRVVEELTKHQHMLEKNLMVRVEENQPQTLVGKIQKLLKI